MNIQTLKKLIKSPKRFLLSWYLLYRGKLLGIDAEYKEEVQSRLDICYECPIRNKTRCGDCGCPLEALAMLPENCPKNKW